MANFKRAQGTGLKAHGKGGCFIFVNLASLTLNLSPSLCVALAGVYVGLVVCVYLELLLQSLHLQQSRGIHSSLCQRFFPYTPPFFTQDSYLETNLEEFL